MWCIMVTKLSPSALLYKMFFMCTPVSNKNINMYVRINPKLT